MSAKRPEPVQVVKQRRDAALAALVESVPYTKFLGISFDRRGDELTGVLHFRDGLIGNPWLPALHGGATAAFLEVTAAISLCWSHLWADIESGAIDPENLNADDMPRMPKTIDITVDYLRSGLPRDAYARARINRQGRRYASVHVEAWQDNRARLFAQATGHFLMPPQASVSVPDADRPNLFAKLEEASKSQGGSGTDD
nr:PaaI family thioesterase [Chachezhania antarctica]|tara:strand:- start:1582 stop:2178 length:597 start_codon:yes stop_codon:yes gene_type:complete